MHCVDLESEHTITEFSVCPDEHTCRCIQVGPTCSYGNCTHPDGSGKSIGTFEAAWIQVELDINVIDHLHDSHIVEEKLRKYFEIRDKTVTYC